MAGFFRKIGQRIVGALFEKATEQAIPVLVPANPTTNRAVEHGGRADIPHIEEVREGVATPAEVPVARTTITAWSTKGILRSRTVWVGILYLVYELALKPLLGIDLDVVQLAGIIMDGDNLVSIATTLLMAIFRVKANTLTRG